MSAPQDVEGSIAASIARATRRKQVSEYRGEADPQGQERFVWS